jgi:FAD dependent monooxygenase
MGSTTKPFKVIIVGGGIAGLSMAHALTLTNINFVVLEKRENPIEPSGAGLGSWPHSVPLLKQFGVFDALSATHTPLIDSYHNGPDGRILNKYPVFDDDRQK